MQEATQDADGTVLQGTGGDVVLFAAPGVGEAGSVLRYQEIFRAGAADSTADGSTDEEAIDSVENGTIPSTAEPRSSIYLPWVTTDADETVATNITPATAPPSAETTVTLEPATSPQLQPQWFGNMRAYHVWEIDTLPAAESGDAAQNESAPDSFPMQAEIDVQWLSAQGIDPDTLDVWTRANEAEAWQRVEAEYNAEAQTFSAILYTTQQTGLGEGLNESGEVLPSVSHLTSDLQTGGSNIHYPIDLPQGLGGMAPALSLGYSSVSVDDLRDANGLNDPADDVEWNDEYVAQAGLAGLGWNIGGLSYIARAKGLETIDDFLDDEYQLVLNGQSSKLDVVAIAPNNIYGAEASAPYGVASPWTFFKIRYGLIPVRTQNGREVRHSGEWIVTTSDGTKHYFGSSVNPLGFDGQGKLNKFEHQGLILSAGNNQNGSFYTWVANKWYLRQSIDPLGNKIEYHYDAEFASVGDCSSTSANYDDQTYHSAVRPNEIRWSFTGVNPPGDPSGPRDRQSYKMRVQFDYEDRSMQDWQVKDYEGDDCMQAMFSKKRLQDIRVRVKNVNNSGWHTLRRYHLDYNRNSPQCAQYVGDFNVGSIHSQLASIAHYGEDGGLLNRQCFFHLRKNGAKHGQVYIGRVNNGWGAMVEYGYQKVRLRLCQVSDNYVIDDPADGPVSGPECPRNDTFGTDKRWFVSTMGTYNDGLGGGTSVVRFEYAGRTALQLTRDSVDYYLGYKFARTVYYFKNSYNGDASNQPSPAQKVVETTFHRDADELDGPNFMSDPNYIGTQKGDDANPDPRAGRIKQIDTYRPVGSGCETYQTAHSFNPGYLLTNYNFCLIARTSTEWQTYLPNSLFTEWTNTTNNYWARPIWTRQNSQSQWADGVEYEQRFFYDRWKKPGQNRFGQQNGDQFGNVTTMVEGFVRDPNGSNEAFVRLRSTAYDYVPHVKRDEDGTSVDESIYIVSLPSRVRVFGRTNDCHAEMRSIYTVGALGNNYKSRPTSNVVAKTEQALTGCSETADIPPYNDNWAIMHYFHDQYGNVRVKNGLGKTSNQNITIETAYDGTYKLFPIRQWNQHLPSFEEKMVYYGVNGPSADANGAFWGAMRRYCGVSTVCSRQFYDEFGRRTKLWEGGNAGGSQGNGDWGPNTKQWYYHRYQDPQYPALTSNVVIEWSAPQCEGNFVRRHYNGLGQLVKEQMPDDYWRINQLSDGTNCNQSNSFSEIESDYQYDALGNQTRASVPYRRGGWWVGRGLSWGAGYTESSYDALNRPTFTEAPNGEQMRHRYDWETVDINGINNMPLRVAESKALGQLSGEGSRILSWQGTDVLGRLTATRNYRWNSGSQSWVTDAEVLMAYDPADRLTKTMLPGGAQSTMGYDAGGRKLSMTDPDLGTWTYVYDRQNRLTNQVDARGCVTNLLYDDRLGRLRQKSFTSLGGSACASIHSWSNELVTYDYDEHHSNVNRSRGQLTKVQVRHPSTNYVTHRRNLWYNPRGLLALERVSIGGSSVQWDMVHGYDPSLRPVQLRYPDNELVTTWINSRGLPNTVATGPQGAYNNIVDNVGYTEAGQMNRMHMPRRSSTGSDLWRRNIYYSWTENAGNGNRRLKEVRVGRVDFNNQTLSFRYTYDSFGNLKNLMEQYDGTTLPSNNFGYDLQMRVTSAFGQNFQWQPSGNFQQFNGNNYTYASNHVHAVEKKNGSVRYAYDANGNMIWRDKNLPQERYLEWDVDNRLGLVRTAPSANIVESYRYDDGNQRVAKYVYNGSGAVAETVYYPYPQFEVRVGQGAVVAAAMSAENPAASVNQEIPIEGPILVDGYPLPLPVPDFLLNAPGPTEAELEATLDIDIGDPPGPQCPIDLGELEPCILPPVEPIDPEPIEPVDPEPIDPINPNGDVQATTVLTNFVGTDATFLPLVASDSDGDGTVEAAAANQSYTNTKYYFLGAQRVFMTEGGFSRYIHPDHLGGTAIETDLSGSVTAERRYLAFGGKRGNSVGLLRTEHRFTSQKLDETGLYYYGARYYDPELGQFVSPDTIVPDATEVFAYNRYMYTYGNPLNYTDPSGHTPGGPTYDGGGSCATINNCYTLLSPAKAAKQQAEIDLLVDVEASIIFGDLNDVGIVLFGYDAISNESVPHLSEEWGEAIVWMLLPFGSRSGAKAVENIVDETVGTSRRLGSEVFDVVPYRPTNKPAGKSSRDNGRLG